jgi:hypothetical protein
MGEGHLGILEEAGTGPGQINCLRVGSGMRILIIYRPVAKPSSPPAFVGAAYGRELCREYRITGLIAVPAAAYRRHPDITPRISTAAATITKSSRL